MPAATVTLDMDRLLPEEPGAVVVERIADYPPACVALREALRNGGSIRIAVRQRTAAAWFTRLAAAYGEDQVAVRRYTPRDALRDHWRIEIPPEVTDREILQTNLLEERITAREGQSFPDLLLEHFYTGQFAYRTFPTAQLSALLNDYDAKRWKAASRRPLVARMLARKLARWEQAARSEATRVLIRRLGDDPASLRRDLARFKVLSLPDVAWEKLLGATWELFRRARVETEELRLTAADTADLAPHVEYYLSDLLPSLASAEDVAALLDQLSGHLAGEFSFVEKALGANPGWITPQLLRRVEVRFRPLRAGIGSRIAALRRRIRPPFPEAPGTAWSAAEWLSWAAESYMPYYSWLEAQRQQDDTVADYASAFADWYYDCFCSLKTADPGSLAFSALWLDRDRIRGQDTVALVVLLDNFNYTHFGALCEVFNERGLFLDACRPVLSLIPTATEVGKAALIASRGDQVDLPTDRYPDLVQAEWQPLLQQKTATYLANIGELQQLAALQHDLYFLNFLPVDQELHRDVRGTGRPHEEAVRDCLEALASVVAEFASRFHLGNRLQVYVLSDHGSTRIARGTVNVLDKQFYKGLADEKHHRYLTLADAQFQKLPQVASAQCYLIDRVKFKTNQNYLAARAYFRFAETTDDFYVHGGLSPEEVVVPYARFSLVPVTPEAPTLILPVTEFRYAVPSRIPVEIGNPNAFPLEAVSVRLLDAPGAEAFLDSLPPKQTRTVELVTRFRKTPGVGNTRDLTLRIRFSHQGRHFSPADTTFPVTMKTLMEVTGDDLDF